MSRLFDTIAIVDWSARSRPSPARPSADSIWWAFAHDGVVGEPVYARTRAAALDALGDLLADEVSRGRCTLIGFDFPFGYPAGTAAAVTGQAEAMALWHWLDRRIEDGPDNANNRFAVAEAFNACFDGTGPLWGRPAGWDHPGVPTRGTERHGNHPPERRLVERQFSRTQPTWKLYTTGSVGSQILLGLPALLRLREDRRLDAAVWPFETGLAGPKTAVTLAEIYPSLLADAVAAQQGTDEITDAAQVRVNAAAYARLDAEGKLAALFHGAPDLTDEQRDLIEREEAWILGVGHEQTLREAA